jgi:hypothetical protein
MRSAFAAFGLLTLALASSESASAASACTAWMNYDGSQKECMNMMRRQTNRAGFKGDTTEATMFFWFDNNVVTARCIADKGLIAFAAYHRQNDRACPLMDRIKDVIEP